MNYHSTAIECKIDPIQQFRQALLARGIIPPDELIADGRIHRCDVEGKNGKGDASYLLHLDGVPAGGFENHRDGMGWEPFKADIGRRLTTAEKAANREQVAAARREREATEERRRKEAAYLAHDQWARAQPCLRHPYTVKKGIGAHGTRIMGDSLLIPLRDVNGVIHSMQYIRPNGDKKFMPGGRVRGHFYLIGKPGDVLCLAEGFATGASIHEATGNAVAVAFNALNLVPVAVALREKYPELRIIICADDDYQTEGNPGLTKAVEAARLVGGLVAVPNFGRERA